MLLSQRLVTSERAVRFLQKVHSAGFKYDPLTKQSFFMTHPISYQTCAKLSRAKVLEMVQFTDESLNSVAKAAGANFWIPASDTRVGIRYVQLQGETVYVVNAKTAEEKHPCALKYKTTAENANASGGEKTAEGGATLFVLLKVIKVIFVIVVSLIERIITL